MRVLKQVCLLMFGCLGVAIFLLACSTEANSTDVNAKRSRSNGVSNVNSFDRQELARYRALWKSKKITTYEMFLEVMNSTNIAKRVEIKVENGIAKSVVKVDSSDSGSVEQYAPYNTIEKIFNIVDRESNVQHDVFTVKYDGTLGYPKNISSDLRRDWADDEWSLNVVSLITR